MKVGVYSIRKARKQGKKDGRNWKWKFWPFTKEEKKAVPEDNFTDIAPYEKEIKEGIEKDISDLAEKWEEKDKELKKRYCQALSEFNESKKRLEKETKEAEQAKSRLDSASKKLIEIGRPHISSGWKIFWLIFLGLSEFPLNGIVFSIFGAGRIETYLIAAGLCAIIPLLAHWIGKIMRQEERSNTDVFIIYGILLVVLLGFIAIAIMRADYLADVLKEMGGSITPAMAGFLFVIINMVIFTGATVVSYEGTHPRHDEYKIICKEYKEALKSFSTEAREAKVAIAIYDEKMKELQDAKTNREKTFKAFKERAVTMSQAYEWMAQAYRTENARARGKTIKCLNLPKLEVQIPESLKELDWECDSQNKRVT